MNVKETVQAEMCSITSLLHSVSIRQVLKIYEYVPYVRSTASGHAYPVKLFPYSQQLAIKTPLAFLTGTESRCRVLSPMTNN